MFESPVATKTTRARTATAMPRRAQNIQSGKKAPNKTKDGAPLEHPPKVNDKIGASNTLACSLGERIELTSAISLRKPITGDDDAVNGPLKSTRIMPPPSKPVSSRTPADLANPLLPRV